MQPVDPSNVAAFKPRFSLSVIRSAARLTYAQAQTIINGEIPVDLEVHPSVTKKQVGSEKQPGCGCAVHTSS